MAPKKTVLVVDDSVTIREGLRYALSQKGYEVIVAVDTVQGITLAREKQPALIVLDLQMPGGGGAVVLERLQSNSTTRDIPIIIYTSAPTAGLQLPASVRLLAKTDHHRELVEFVAKSLG